MGHFKTSGTAAVILEQALKTFITDQEECQALFPRKFLKAKWSEWNI